MGPHLKVSEIFRIATSFRKSKKNCNPGISINSLTKKIHHATPDRPLSRRDLRKVSFSTSPDPRSWAWLLWSQKTSPQIGSAARMTTSPWRKKQKKTYPAITPENFPFGRCWTNHRYIYIDRKRSFRKQITCNILQLIFNGCCWICAFISSNWMFPTAHFFVFSAHDDVPGENPFSILAEKQSTRKLQEVR